ncbi:hypothetical protein A7A09_000290 [Paracoccus methylarcula]|uniref:Phosphate acetyl/butaryl transferase domain-containing protein n=1 Tax=Paracoccus methylarcula TaxID=72022 RepID=A0A3R7MBA1_9RHOB|nr:hypothetical protein A7A09_000290 [Paracoccus methylarcula]
MLAGHGTGLAGEEMGSEANAYGNIGYKIAECLGELTALGPILKELAKPANDLLRGCIVGEGLAAAAITALQAG